MSIIITIINNSTALVQHNVICFEYFMPIKLLHLPQLLACCFTRNTLSTFFHSDQIIAKKLHFQSKTIFFFNLLLVGFDFAGLYICVS